MSGYFNLAKQVAKKLVKSKKGKTISSIKPFSSINAPYNIGAGTKTFSAQKRAEFAKTEYKGKQYDKRYAKRKVEEDAKRKAEEAKKIDAYKPSGKFTIKKKKSWKESIDKSNPSYKDKWPG